MHSLWRVCRLRDHKVELQVMAWCGTISQDRRFIQTSNVMLSMNHKGERKSWNTFNVDWWLFWVWQTTTCDGAPGTITFHSSMCVRDSLFFFLEFMPRVLPVVCISLGNQPCNILSNDIIQLGWAWALSVHPRGWVREEFPPSTRQLRQIESNCSDHNYWKEQETKLVYHRFELPSGWLFDLISRILAPCSRLVAPVALFVVIA